MTLDRESLLLGLALGGAFGMAIATLLALGSMAV